MASRRIATSKFRAPTIYRLTPGQCSTIKPSVLIKIHSISVLTTQPCMTTEQASVTEELELLI